MNTEFEVKFLLDNTDILRQQLKDVSATLVFNKTLFKRKIFGSNVLGEDQWIRVRDEYGKVMLCTKKSTGSNDIHAVQEYETQVSNFDEICIFLQNIGFKESLYCENYRELWELDECKISIDYWPALNPFVEIEGLSEGDVYRVVDLLHFSMNNAVFGSSFNVYEKVYGVSRDFYKNITQLTFENITPDYFK